MPEIVISDTSTLIIFQKIDRLDILHSNYGDLSTTPEIAEESGLPLPEWVKVKSVKDKKYQSFLETQVDREKRVLLP